MACDFPLAAYKSAIVNPSGKRSMQFKAAGSHSGVRQLIGCGKCAGCRLERTRIWAVRMLHEKKMHKENSFITVTYKNECLPQGGTLVFEDYQNFMKRLRENVRRHGDGRLFRFYGCGEYGDEFSRPHYHFILFGLDFNDKVFYKKNARGEDLYTSAALDYVWGKGMCTIGAVTFESCQYVAKYCMKVVNGEQREEGHYLVYDADGVVYERLPEFSTMSTQPGLGSAYYARFGSEIRAHDSIVIDGQEVPSIRYYDLKHEALDPVGFAVIKARRLRKRMRMDFLERVSPDRRRVREIIRLKRLSQSKRGSQ